MCVVETDCVTNDGNEELADHHAAGAVDQEWSTSEPLDCPEGKRGRANIDKVEDEGDQERVADGAR